MAISRNQMLLSAAVGVTLALAGCREDGRRPSADLLALPATEALPYGYAPAAYDLDPVRPAPLGRLLASDERYAWAERGYGMDYAFYDTPPDYAVVYDDVQPWVWETADDWILVQEPLSAGYRSYYYAPGYERPFLVRDPECAYGYDNDGRLVAVYLHDGSVLQSDQLLRYDDVAGRYLYRGSELYDAARQPRRYAVAEPLWSQQRPTLLRAQSTWMSTAASAPEWRAYRDRTDRAVLTQFRGVRDERVKLERERGGRAGFGGAASDAPRMMRAQTLARDGASGRDQIVGEQRNGSKAERGERGSARLQAEPRERGRDFANVSPRLEREHRVQPSLSGRDARGQDRGQGRDPSAGEPREVRAHGKADVRAERARGQQGHAEVRAPERLTAAPSSNPRAEQSHGRGGGGGGPQAFAQRADRPAPAQQAEPGRGGQEHGGRGHGQGAAPQGGAPQAAAPPQSAPQQGGGQQGGGPSHGGGQGGGGKPDNSGGGGGNGGGHGKNH